MIILVSFALIVDMSIRHKSDVESSRFWPVFVVSCKDEEQHKPCYGPFSRQS